MQKKSICILLCGLLLTGCRKAEQTSVETDNSPSMPSATSVIVEPEKTDNSNEEPMSDEEEVIQEENKDVLPDEDTLMTTYQEVFDRYRNKETESEDPISELFTEETEIGYAFIDFDFDSTPELLFGDLNGDGTIFDLYASIDGKLVHVLSSTSSESYYPTTYENQHLSIGKHISYDSSYVEEINYVWDSEELVVQSAVKYDASASPQWMSGFEFEHELIYDDLIPLDDKSGNALMDEIRSTRYIPSWTKLSVE